jgi:chromosome segregation ATPase
MGNRNTLCRLEIVHAGCRMDSWDRQRESAKATIAEIENKIALQTQRAEQLRSQNKDASVPVRLISVLQESLARAKTHAEYIEQRIADYRADANKRTARKALINIAETERQIAEYDRKATELETAIRAEEDRTGIRDPAHASYPAAAREKIERRNTLLSASAALKRRLADAKGALDRALPGRGAD